MVNVRLGPAGPLAVSERPFPVTFEPAVTVKVPLVPMGFAGKTYARSFTGPTYGKTDVVFVVTVVAHVKSPPAYEHAACAGDAEMTAVRLAALLSNARYECFKIFAPCCGALI